MVLRGFPAFVLLAAALAFVARAEQPADSADAPDNSPARAPQLPAPLHISGGTDVGPASGGFLVVGSSSGLNIGLDNNELQARNNGSPASMTINGEGGRIILGGPAGGDVGVKTTNPQADFHVAGDVRIDGTLSIPTATRYLSLSAMDFAPQFNAQVQFTGAGPALQVAGGVLQPSLVANAPVSLPHGAVITEVRAFIDDTSSSNNAWLGFFAVPHTGTTSGSTLATITSSGSGGPGQYADSLSHTVDNQANAYILAADWDDGVSPTIRLRSVLITYTIDQPLP